MFYDKLSGAPPASGGQTAEGNQAACILLFGEVLVDCFPDREVAGGAPLNVAHHLARLGQGVGVVPVLVTRIGKDEPGHRLLESIQAAGLPVEGVQQDCLHPTGTVRIALDGPAGHRFEIAPDQAWDFIHADMARLVGLMSRPQWIYFGTLAQRAASRPALRSLLQTTRAEGFLDVNLRDPWVRKDVLRWSLGKTEIVKMNEAELHRVAHMVGLGSGAPRELARRLSHAYDIRNVLVTQGEQGAWLQTADGACFQTRLTQPGADVASEAVDSVGAGDAFAAVFLLGQTQGWPTALTLDRAHQFAGQICRVRGAIPDSADFYRPFIKAWDLTIEHAA
jgi:fructokinase